jgi:TrmH family RNA methyltransferase
VLRAASDTQAPQGILAVLAQRSLPLPEPLDFAFIPDGVRDPGNLGSMLRTAAAAGAGAVLLPAGTVDGFAPKVVRSGMGAHFRLPVHACPWDEIRRLVQDSGLSVYLAAAGDGLPYTQADFRGPLALVIGGEAEGAGSEAQALAHQRVSIPMPGGVESLNAAAAAAILLFEVVRQRKEKPG